MTTARYPSAHVLLRELTVLSKKKGSVPSTHMSSTLSVIPVLINLLMFLGTGHILVHIHMFRQTYKYKYINKCIKYFLKNTF